MSARRSPSSAPPYAGSAPSSSGSSPTGRFASRRSGSCSAAFRIEQSLRNVLLVQAAQSLATLVPISPGGVGTEQAFLVYTLRGQASRSALLAFSVGMRLTLTAVNVVLGFTAILLTLRTLRFRRATRPRAPAPQRLTTPPARRSGAAARTPSGPSSPAGRAPPRAPPARRRGTGRPSRVPQDRAPPCRADPVERVEDRLDARVSRC